ncbi:MAG: PAS domain-containing protein [Rhodospirillales bacterium]|nr:PAS domain-containing protein [Rhodospirillales bacterium]
MSTDLPIELPDLPAGATHPDFRALHDYWRAKAPPGSLPGRQHIDPVVDIPALVPRLALYDVVETPTGLRFRVRVAGEVLIEVMGLAPAGRFVDEFIVPERRATLNDAFTQVARERIVHYWEKPMWTAGRQYIRMQRLALPLARDGRNVDMIFAGHVRVPADPHTDPSEGGT